MADDVYCLGRGVCAIRAKGETWAFLHQLVNSELERLLARVTGSVFPNLNGPDFKEFTVIAPPLPLLSKFQQVAEPLLSQLGANVRESRTLAETRDALLPKLLSGKIRIGDPQAVQLETP